MPDVCCAGCHVFWGVVVVMGKQFPNSMIANAVKKNKAQPKGHFLKRFSMRGILEVFLLKIFPENIPIFL